jgi:hypothetical protein
MAHSTYTYSPGLGQSAAYQVSGKPFVTGNVNPAVTSKIGFPGVTSWVVVSNNDNATVRVAFSANGLNAGHSNYYTVPANSQSPRLDLKVTELHLSTGGSNSVDIMAGITYIDTEQINNSSVSPSGTNWSGSAGALVG